jgi:hypothetical protein
MGVIPYAQLHRDMGVAHARSPIQATQGVRIREYHVDEDPAAVRSEAVPALRYGELLVLDLGDGAPKVAAMSSLSSTVHASTSSRVTLLFSGGPAAARPISQGLHRARTALPNTTSKQVSPRAAAGQQMVSRHAELSACMWILSEHSLYRVFAPETANRRTPWFWA